MSSPPAPGAITRRRRRTSDPGLRWASLPEDLVGVVASRLLAGDLLDYVRFRAVCTTWRSGVASPRGRGVADPRFHPRRWMMLPEGHCLHPGHPDLAGHARFLNLDTGTLVRVRIPLLGDHCAIDSVEGLLLLLRDPDQEGAVRLLHPFTGDVAELPPLGPLLLQLGSRLLSSCPAPYRIRRLARIISASVSFNAGTMTVMLALHEVRRVAFATSMDRQWTLSGWECPTRYPPFSFQGKLYMVQTPRLCGKKIHQVLQIDPPVQDRVAAGRVLQQPKVIATIPAHKLVYPYGLVECGSEILVLGHNDLFESEILVCKLADLVLQRFIPIKGIRGSTLFLQERNISVSSKVLHTVKGDNVVYICSGPPYLAQYNLSSGSLSPAIDSCCLYGRALGPSSLIHYIFSCCIRNR
uniref:KIB1-4 beta-propeller domain-containing protein n=1 Tax=Arundo donax TaxID=35708 RepID=A0A0A9CVC2_ARUDO